jgi:hypothetical protein
MTMSDLDVLDSDMKAAAPGPESPGVSEPSFVEASPTR